MKKNKKEFFRANNKKHIFGLKHSLPRDIVHVKESNDFDDYENTPSKSLTNTPNTLYEFLPTIIHDNRI